MNIAVALQEVQLTDSEQISYASVIQGAEGNDRQGSLTILGEEIVFERMLHGLGLSRASVANDPKLRSMRNESMMNIKKIYGSAMRVAIETEQQPVFDYMRSLVPSENVETTLEQINALLNAINHIVQRKGYSMPERAREFLAETLIQSFESNQGGCVIPKKFLESDEATIDLVENDLGALLHIYSLTFRRIAGTVGTFFQAEGIPSNARIEGEIAQDVVDEIGYEKLTEIARSGGETGVNSMIDGYVEAIRRESCKEIERIKLQKQKTAVHA